MSFWRKDRRQPRAEDGVPSLVVDAAGAINYDLAIMLDAEDLAERGVATAYGELAAHLVALGVSPTSISESYADEGDYAVAVAGRTYLIHSPDSPDDSWGLATFALFDIVNRQLTDSPTRLYALNGGNDLFGIFMTADDCARARSALPAEKDWPYLPTDEPDWFGMPHD